MTKIVALVPMRHSSERVPGKNYRDFGGAPLYHRVIETLLRSPLITEVVIDTDSPIIQEDTALNFPSVKVLERPECLRAGTVPMNDVLLNAIRQVDADFYLQTHSTNPLIQADTVNKAVQSFLDNHPLYDSLFGVTRLQTRLWDSLARAVNHNPAILLRTQDLPPIYEENSCLYIFDRVILETLHNRIGNRPLMFEVDRLEAVDIDEEADFRIAELLYKESQKEPQIFFKAA